jgi:predicted AAA+ superfamily ATPase
MNGLVKRHLAEPAAEAMETFRGLIIEGARQVGKSTFAQMLVEGRPHLFLTLDDPAVAAAAREDPWGFVTRAPGQTLVIDELQRVPELVLAIKMATDRDPRPGRFVLTGSSDLLRRQVAPDSLAGRAVRLALQGFSQGELAGTADDFAAHVRQGGDFAGTSSAMTQRDYAELICRGTYPEAQTLGGRPRDLWFSSYLQSLVRRDVADISPALSGRRFQTLLRLLAANQSGETVVARLAEHARMSESSVRTYLDTAATLFLTSSLPPWTPNRTKAVTGRHKTIVKDSALAAHLARHRPEQLVTLEGLPAFGGLLEGLVTAELRRQQGWTACPFDLYHFRDREGREVDIVLEFFDGKAFLIEVKSSQTHRPQFTQTIRYLQERLPGQIIGGAVLQPVAEAFGHGRGVWSLPISALWD